MKKKHTHLPLFVLAPILLVQAKFQARFEPRSSKRDRTAARFSLVVLFCFSFLGTSYKPWQDRHCVQLVKVKRFVRLSQLLLYICYIFSISWISVLPSSFGKSRLCFSFQSKGDYLIKSIIL